MVLVPAVTPVITPAVLMVATDGVLLLHVPPVVVLLTVVVSPAHTCSVPVMAAGSGFTVTVAVRIQPVPSEYVIVAVAAVVLPVSTPLTVPVASTVATAVLLLAQVPPAVVVLNTVVAP
jgi:hypothetical protein